MRCLFLAAAVALSAVVSAGAQSSLFESLYRESGADALQTARESPGPGGPARAIKRGEARGEIAGEPVSTTVDSAEAALYLEGRLAESPELKRKIDAYRSAAADVPLHELGPILQDAARKISPDVAALLFAELASKTGLGPGRREEFGVSREQWKAAGGRVPAEARDLVVLAVPGFLYRSNPGSGADLQQVLDVAHAMGLRAERVATGENASVEDNARIVADEIRRRGAAGEKLILISGSKSSAEVAEALGGLLRPDEVTPVRAWINAAGILRGTPLVDMGTRGIARLGVWAEFKAKGHDLAGLTSLRSDVRRPSFSRLSFPGSILIVNVVPVPMSGDISAQNVSFYKKLKTLGPNDGLTLLTDAIVPGAVTLIKPGVDHYMGKTADAEALGSLIFWISRPR